MLKKFVSAVLCVMLALTTTVIGFTNSPAYSVEAADDYEIPYYPYYYEQLSENGKIIYQMLKEAVLECKKEVKIDNTNMSEGDFNKITEILLMHDPMTFNIKDIKATIAKKTSAGKTVTASITFTLVYTYNKETYDKMAAAYEEQVDDILSRLTDDMTIYAKINTIHDEIIKTAVYDLESPANDTIYGALVEKKAKCDGYARTFSYICAKAGICATTVLGIASKDGDSEYHMWNKVYYNQKWYNIDVTWDDPITNMKDNCSHEYFMLSDEDIGRSHLEANMSFFVPESADNSLTYYQAAQEYASNLSEAKKLINSGLTSAVKNGTTYYEFKCSSQSVYDETMNYVAASGNISGILKNAKNNSGKKVAANVYSYNLNDDQYVIRIMIFYEGTKLDDYFVDIDAVDSSTAKVLAKFGIG